MFDEKTRVKKSRDTVPLSPLVLLVLTSAYTHVHNYTVVLIAVSCLLQEGIPYPNSNRPQQKAEGEQV
jgi:hypothetical protein